MSGVNMSRGNVRIHRNSVRLLFDSGVRARVRVRVGHESSKRPRRRWMSDMVSRYHFPENN